ncbi:MAG: DUF3365 domain-containing protein [Planctomycetaceae bacterium]|nr:DUF3365 domain-containing protein [Planctomycetaceae bacterium]
MRGRASLWPAALIVAVSCACGAGTDAPSAAQVEAATQAAERACGELQKELVAALGEAMGKGGPVAAIEVCQLRAPQLAAKVGEAARLDVGRTALGLRNAANAPDAWERTTLEEFKQSLAGGAAAEGLEKVQLEKIGDGHQLRYMRAIATQPVCLTCHGDELLPELREELARRYPEDRAIGFKAGELRGAFTVTVRLDS